MGHSVAYQNGITEGKLAQSISEDDWEGIKTSAIEWMGAHDANEYMKGFRLGYRVAQLTR
jgi:hypothetical protein